jgi:hypothetical protein
MFRIAKYTDCMMYTAHSSAIGETDLTACSANLGEIQRIE